MNTLLPRFLARAALLAAVAAPAFAQSFAATQTKSYGNSVAGGTTTARAAATLTLPTPTNLLAPTTVQATASNVASVRLFGLTREAASMRTSVRVDHVITGLGANGLQFTNTSSGSFAVRIGGRAMLSDARTNVLLTNNLAADVFLSDVPTRTVSMLGIGVTVRGGVTGRARYALTPQVDFANLSVALDGPLRTSAIGRASASVSALGATAGVTSTLTYADTTANLAVDAAPGGVTGTIAGTIQQVRFVINVFASFLGATANQRLIDLATPAEPFSRNLAPQ